MFSIHTVKNAVLVSLTPVASSLVRQLRSTTTGGVILSSLPIAASRFGSFISMVCFYFFIPFHEHKSRAPFFAMAAAPTLGELIRAMYS